MIPALLTTVVPAAALYTLALLLAPRERRQDDGWQPGQLAAVKAMPDRPLTGTVQRRQRTTYVPTVRRKPVLIDPYLGVLPVPPVPVGTPTFDRLYAVRALDSLTAQLGEAVPV